MNDRYDRILAKVSHRGCGKFQVFTTCTVLLAMIGQSYLDYGLAYLIMMPELICTETGEVCTTKDICLGESTPQVDYYINYEDPFSLHNWVQQYNLICSGGLQLSLFGVLSLLGGAMANLPLTAFSDRVGRKWLFRAGCLAQCIVFATVMVTKKRKLS